MSHTDKHYKYKSRYNDLLQFVGGYLFEISYHGTPIKSQMDLSQVQDKPDFILSDNSNLYTLIMVDPDTAIKGYWLHWMIVNNTEEVVPYHPPTPPSGSGPHRYIFFLYKQPSRINFNDNINQRASFDIESYVNKYHLQKVATKMFVAEKI